MFYKINDKLVKAEKSAEEIQEEQAYLQSDEYKQIQISELKQKLADTDYIACKIAEGSATVNDYFEEISKRQLWREQINTLEGNDNDG